MSRKPQPQQGQQPLLTPTSLSLSLAPPRSPPIESWIGELHHYCLHDLLKRKHAEVRRLTSKTNRDDGDTAQDLPHHKSHELLSRLFQSIMQKEERKRHYHNNEGSNARCKCTSLNNPPRRWISLPDRMTRYIGSALPLHWQHDFRDSGKFRSVADGLVKISCPLVAAGRWKEIRDFVDLSRPIVDERADSSGGEGETRYDSSSSTTEQTRRRWKKEQIRYGEHDMQHIDLFWPNLQGVNGNDKASKQKSISGTIIFVHGGAWGSGQPWMYRLCAPYFLEQGFLVAIVGYRTFPCVRVVVHDLEGAGGGIGDSQLCDIKSAWDALQSVMGQVLSTCKDTEGWIGNVLMGHSSGAHIALLMLVDMIEERLKSNNDASAKIYPDFFIGLSGPYDIGNHYDFEAGRGVEQLSPMKAICGGTRDNFSVASPVSRMLKKASLHHASVQECVPPILLIHGIEDSTVPFTATADAARSLRSCGLVHCDEVYLEKCEHQDVVMHLMLGGQSREVMMEYLLGWRDKRENAGVGFLSGSGSKRIQVFSRL